MDAWHTVTEIEEILHSETILEDQDRLMNALLGVIELGNERFNKLFDEFERDLKERYKLKGVTVTREFTDGFEWETEDEFCHTNCTPSDHHPLCTKARDPDGDIALPIHTD